MTKREAFQEMRERQACDESVKVVRVSGVMTVPGRGVTPWERYEVRAK